MRLLNLLANIKAILALRFLLFLSWLHTSDNFLLDGKSCNQEKKCNENLKARVAFIFAGSPRSFIHPPVHETIRQNLISAFCPLKYCISDVFIRLSSADNIHYGFNSSGIFQESDGNLLPKIKYGLSRLNPQENKSGVTEIDWTDIGSDKEKNEMLNSPFTSRRHKIFRTLDPRRYSMYFNRWSAYQKAIKKESDLGFKYTWIVHARLDSAFGEPIPPYYGWALTSIFVPNSWAAEVPDNFALLPRNYSDSYYSMEHLIQPNIFCLGGGNFHPNTLNT